MPNSLHPLTVARAAGALWQFRLRRSVRLRLVLQEPWARDRSVDVRLRLVERQLLLHLLRPRPGQQPLAMTPARAQLIIERAQHAMLNSEAMVAAILAEFSLQRAVQPVRDASIRQLS